MWFVTCYFHLFVIYPVFQVEVVKLDWEINMRNLFILLTFYSNPDPILCDWVPSDYPQLIKMSVTAVFVTNLPHGISGEELRMQLVNYHPFGEWNSQTVITHSTRNYWKTIQTESLFPLFLLVFDGIAVQVAVYHSPKQNPVAVIKGLDCNFEKLLMETRDLCIVNGGFSTNCVIKPVSFTARFIITKMTCMAWDGNSYLLILIKV